MGAGCSRGCFWPLRTLTLYSLHVPALPELPPFTVCLSVPSLGGNPTGQEQYLHIPGRDFITRWAGYVSEAPLCGGCALTPDSASTLSSRQLSQGRNDICKPEMTFPTIKKWMAFLIRSYAQQSCNNGPVSSIHSANTDDTGDIHRGPNS